MPVDNSLFDILANSIVRTMTYFINEFSGELQVAIYLLIAITFFFALAKSYQSFRSLTFRDSKEIVKRIGSNDFHGSIKSPLSVITAGFFKKTKKYYIEEKENGETSKVIPPDAFIRDAAFQFSERYFEEKFLQPLTMTANLMPPQGFIGTIIGMVIHFLSNTGTLNSDVTIAGIATALYTTLIALACYTSLEFLKKTAYTLAHKRINEGLVAVSKDIYSHSGDNPGKENED